MLPHLAQLKGIALDLLFPQICVGCGKESEFICPSCRRSLPRIVPPLCPLCGKSQTNGVLCPNCVNWQAAIDGIRSPFKFDGVIRQAVHQLKYNNIRALSGILANYMSDYFIQSSIPTDVLVPVPLHAKRLKERGYNQSGLLAHEMGKKINLPIIDDCLVRLRPTTPQAKTTSVEERRENVAGAFDCRNPILRNTRVLLIDDVSTSGATVNACAAALKACGTLSVWALVLAREL